MRGGGDGHWHCPHAGARCPLEQADPIGKPPIKLLALTRLLMSSMACRGGGGGGQHSSLPGKGSGGGGGDTAWPRLSLEPQCPKGTSSLSQSQRVTPLLR